MDDEEETVLLSFSLSDIRDCETGGGRVSSGISGSSGISKETAARNTVKKNQINESCVKKKNISFRNSPTVEFITKTKREQHFTRKVAISCH